MSTTTKKAAPTPKPKKKKNYLNNKDMLAQLRLCHEQDAMTNEFAKMIMLLADRYGSRYEYSDYSPHIEDMKAVAVMNVVRAWRSFNLEKYNNPFAYFTQAIKHTFWQYVSQEKKHRLNRDAVLISLGELPSDAYMEDFEKIRLIEKLEKTSLHLVYKEDDTLDVEATLTAEALAAAEEEIFKNKVSKVFNTETKKTKRKKNAK